ncbi:two-component system activity regulator YycH [Rummeliibacillus stabekisii]|uniref:YycH family regulatory protein n=1 Tax=Rummeliibacillus stabekisii TaxID=241244 RepID=UPI00203D3E74|nr:two-component system activity regulator YycH [Rummeliibacillus stabekisii]
MGLKYIEQIKSLLLFVLVFLSITLTFSIWTYKPDYDPLEKQKPPLNVSFEKKQQLADVVKPYRMVFHEKDTWRGTDRYEEMKNMLNRMHRWRISNMTLVSKNANAYKVNQLMRDADNFTLFFPAEVPYAIFQNILPTVDEQPKNLSFNKMILDWERIDDSDELIVFFANTANGQLYKAKVHVDSQDDFYKYIIDKSHSLERYIAYPRERGNTLYLPAQEEKVMQYTYLSSSSSIDKFKNALFTMPKRVKSSIDDTNFKENYTDGVSMMTVNTSKKTLDYVDANAVDNLEKTNKSSLILSTFNFINEHGGWTGDFRYEDVDTSNNKIMYQLYVKDYMVYTDASVTSTAIETVWGETRIARYIRPYYKLVSVPENETVMIESGERAIEEISKQDGVDINDVEEIRPGYYLSTNERPNVFILKPTWFYFINGKWKSLPLVPSAGGEQVGLE